MELKGTRFGDIEYQEKDLIRLKGGLIGMPDQTDFVILDFEEEMPFKWLQSTQEAALGFLVGDPLLFCPEYELGLDSGEFADLGVKAPEDLAIFVLCAFKGRIEETTANLLGPIIVHVENRVGRQVIVEDSEYSIETPIYLSETAETDRESKVAEKVVG